MPRASKGLVVALVVVSVVMTFAAVTFYMGRSAEEKKRLWAESQLEEVLRAKSALEREKEELTKAKTDLEAKAQELDGKVTTLTSDAQRLSNELAEEKQAAMAARDELTAAQKQAEDATARLETERREKTAIADELAKAKQDVKRIQDELTQLRQAKEALERRVKEMMGGTSTPDTIVVTPPKGAVAPAQPAPSSAGPVSAGPPSAASVLVVNRDFNFIVVNLGSRDGIKQGQSLEVVRGGRTIARAQVERVYDNMSAANLLPEYSKADIREGDSVRR